MLELGQECPPTPAQAVSSLAVGVTETTQVVFLGNLSPVLDPTTNGSCASFATLLEYASLRGVHALLEIT